MTLPYAILNPKSPDAVARRRLLFAAWYGWSIPFTLGLFFSAVFIWAAIDVAVGYVLFLGFIPAWFMIVSTLYLLVLHNVASSLARRGGEFCDWPLGVLLGYPCLLLGTSAVLLVLGILMSLATIFDERPPSYVYAILLGFPLSCLIFSASVGLIAVWTFLACRRAIASQQ